MEKVLITPRSLTKKPHPAFSLFEEAGLATVFCTPGVMPDEAELLRLLPGCIGYLAGVEKISAKVLEASKNLRVISRNGAGMENVDIEAAKSLGIQVYPTKGANSRGVAELTIGLIISLLRSVPFSNSALKQRRWERREGLEIEGKKLGVIGCGEIGKLTAGMAIALGMEVLGYDMYPNKSYCPENFTWESLEEVVAAADIITLHVPGGNKPVIDVDALSRMKDGAYIINTARASVVDEAAVLLALESGKIAGYAVDAFASEPPSDFSVIEHDRVIATPHIGGFTKESGDRVTIGAIRNIINNLKR